MKRADGTIIRKFPEILAEFEFLEQVDRKSFEQQQYEHPCLKNAVGYALQRSSLNDEEWGILRPFLLGQKVYVKDLKRYGFKQVKKSLTKKNAEQFLNTVLNSLYHLSHNGIILLYDETDRSWLSRRPPPKKVQNAANLIRRFIDACSAEEIKGTLAVFAMLPNFIMDCISCYPALGQRLMRQELSAEVAWRSPVLSVNAVNIDFIDIADEFERRTVFMEKALEKFEDIAIYCGAEPGLITKELRKKAESVLAGNVGDEYKRELIKLLTTATIQRIDKYEGY